MKKQETYQSGTKAKKELLSLAPLPFCENSVMFGEDRTAEPAVKYLGYPQERLIRMERILDSRS